MIFVFCGSNKDNRYDILLHLHKQGINIDVWGEGWEGSPFRTHPQCSILESFVIYKHAKLVLNEMIDDYCYHNGFNRCEKNQTAFYSSYCQNRACKYYTEKVSYTSNRLLIAAYSETPLVTFYNKGLERILTPDKACVVVTMESMGSMIKSLLMNKSLTIDIGKQARHEVRRFSFETLLEIFWKYSNR